MIFDRTGIILYSLKYKSCVDFYENIIGLPKMFENETLTCFEFGGSYLMVEIDDEVTINESESGRTKTCLRMNVQDVKFFADKLKEKKVVVDFQEHSWGTIAKFFDPDGNLCAIKDSAKFEKQIEKYSNTK